LRVVSVGLFHLQVVLGSVLRWYVQYTSIDTASTVRKNSTENDECVAPLSIILLHSATAVRGRYAKTSTQPIANSKTEHVTIYRKTSIDQHIIQSSSMETLTAERHPEGLIAPLLRNDWETALTVVFHSPHYTKRRVATNQGLPLGVAIRAGAPVEVVTALLEAYPDATTIRNYYNQLPCHSACFAGISSEGMKMLLRCNPDATDAITDCGRTPMQCLEAFPWKFFADEKEQVINDLKQHPSYWKSKEQQALLQCALEQTDRRGSMRRSVARIILDRQLDNNDLVPLIIEYAV
jgi:hypothetical protein